MTNTETGTDKAATVAAQGAHVAPKKASLKKGASKKKGTPKGQRAAKGGKAKATAPKKETKAAKAAKPASAKADHKPRTASKGAMILDLLRRAKGATLPQIMEAAGWQAHSVRGFISTAAKKHNITIESSKNEAGERVYTIKN